MRLATGHLLNSSLHGPHWPTGGTVGPEGSATSLALFVVTFIVFDRLYPARRTPQTPPGEC